MGKHRGHSNPLHVAREGSGLVRDLLRWMLLARLALLVPGIFTFLFLILLPSGATGGAVNLWWIGATVWALLPAVGFSLFSLNREWLQVAEESTALETSAKKLSTAAEPWVRGLLEDWSGRTRRWGVWLYGCALAVAIYFTLALAVLLSQGPSSALAWPPWLLLATWVVALVGAAAAFAGWRTTVRALRWTVRKLPGKGVTPPPVPDVEGYWNPFDRPSAPEPTPRRVPSRPEEGPSPSSEGSGEAPLQFGEIDRAIDRWWDDVPGEVQVFRRIVRTGLPLVALLVVATLFLVLLGVLLGGLSLSFPLVAAWALGEAVLALLGGLAVREWSRVLRDQGRGEHPASAELARAPSSPSWGTLLDRLNAASRSLDEALATLRTGYRNLWLLLLTGAVVLPSILLLLLRTQGVLAAGPLYLPAFLVGLVPVVVLQAMDWWIGASRAVRAWQLGLRNVVHQLEELPNEFWLRFPEAP